MVKLNAVSKEIRIATKKKVKRLGFLAVAEIMRWRYSKLNQKLNGYLALTDSEVQDILSACQKISQE
jgi:hypothetical protein